MIRAKGTRTVEAATLGGAWLEVARLILEEGQTATYDGLPMLEVPYVTLDVTAPDPLDGIIAEHADPDRLAWMRTNFSDPAAVPALGNADSYATRLYDYAHSGRDQVAWVIARLQSDRTARSATITTFQPLTDTTYIPCVSLLDFWIPEDKLDLSVYAHSIDFGTKGYGNLIELASVQQHVAASLAVPVGRLVMTVKSAHIYQTEREYMSGVLIAVPPRVFE